MKLILACTAAVFVGNLHTVLGLSSETTTSNNWDSTTDFSQNSDVIRIFQLFENADIVSCVDKQKDVCTKEPANMGPRLNRETFCTTLKLYSNCIENCSQTLRDGTSQALKQFACDGCGFLQGSLLVVMLVTLFHYFL